MVENIQSSQSRLSATESQMEAKDQLFPGAEWSKSDVHNCVGNWVNNIIQTLQNENAQMKKASEELKESEEGK